MAIKTTDKEALAAFAASRGLSVAKVEQLIAAAQGPTLQVVVNEDNTYGDITIQKVFPNGYTKGRMGVFFKDALELATRLVAAYAAHKGITTEEALAEAYGEDDDADAAE